MNLLAVKNFRYGLIDSIEEMSIPRGASSNSNNWLTYGNEIVLRRGSFLLGDTENDTNVGISGQITAKKANGHEVIFRSRGRKVEYYDEDVDTDWHEIGTDLLPAAAASDKVTFAKITTVTGPQVWFNSPNSGLHKIMVANPGSVTAMYDATKNYYGYIAIKDGAIWLWNAYIVGKVPDYVNIYRSYLANKSTADFTQISAEAIGGAGATRTGTLAFKGAGAKRTCLEVTFTDGTETFVDDLNGVLVGSAGGTGTINYTTGAYSVTFAVAPGSPVTATYRWEDSSVEGLADFTFSGTRTAGQGFVLRQGDGGSPMQNIFGYAGKTYCLHKDISWVVTISADDLTITNLVYRSKVGIPNIFGGAETGEGIYYVDDTDKLDPQIRKLALDYAGSEVVPSSVSKKFSLNNEKVGVNLYGYNFDDCCMQDYGNLLLLSCASSGSTVNDTVFLVNKDTGAIDKLDYTVNLFSVFEGALIGGDSLSGNTYTLFSGTDDQSSGIDNEWDSNLDLLDTDRLKKNKRLVIEGNIGPDQEIEVYASLDRGNFVLIDSILGSGSYVDRTQSVNVGAYTLGRGEVGGGGDGISAYHYMKELDFNQDKFQYVKLRFKAVALGWASISQFQYKDIRVKWQKIPSKYRE